MLIVETERLILRDFEKSDIAKRIYWETVETEWQKWDAPWEHQSFTEEQKRAESASFITGLEAFAERIAAKSDADMRYSFQIDLKETGEYIGWISCYCIDAEYNYTDGDGHYAFGIDIPGMAHRGKGYGKEAFAAAIQYLFSCGMTEVYTQTWSGNKPMVALAASIGFQEVMRKKDFRTVDNTKYDAITFVLRNE
ncbi:MAG: GNAT family N-acetyltransferase [Clostridiales bacterium]|nr:GNAT family N-acetyltransferase [Clostridiales bacterium]